MNDAPAAPGGCRGLESRLSSGGWLQAVWGPTSRSFTRGVDRWWVGVIVECRLEGVRVGAARCRPPVAFAMNSDGRRSLGLRPLLLGQAQVLLRIPPARNQSRRMQVSRKWNVLLPYSPGALHRLAGRRPSRLPPWLRGAGAVNVHTCVSATARCFRLDFRAFACAAARAEVPMSSVDDDHPATSASPSFRLAIPQQQQ
ncbi:hypothetical protein C8Q77DRAFT_638259 [Trametes polyzona]|nr:hypothetical protein C8Q77DRAFT_638259 [Trametes polyzona]